MASAIQTGKRAQTRFELPEPSIRCLHATVPRAGRSLLSPAPPSVAPGYWCLLVGACACRPYLKIKVADFILHGWPHTRTPIVSIFVV